MNQDRLGGLDRLSIDKETTQTSTAVNQRCVQQGNLRKSNFSYAERWQLVNRISNYTEVV